MLLQEGQVRVPESIGGWRRPGSAISKIQIPASEKATAMKSGLPIVPFLTLRMDHVGDMFEVV